MKTLTFTPWAFYASIAAALAAAAVFFAARSGKDIPILSNEKAAFYILWIIGFSMSMFSGIRDTADGQWHLPGWLMTPLMIGGILAFILLLVMLFRIPIPWVKEYANAFVLLAGIIAVKWVLAHINWILLLFRS